MLFEFSEELPYSKARVIQFMEYYTLGVISRCLVCLDQYEALQHNSNNGKFEIDLYSRKELICDMEKFENLMKALKIDIKKEANVDN